MSPITRRDAIKVASGLALGATLADAAASAEASPLPAMPARVFATGGLWLSDQEREVLAFQEVELLPDGRWNLLLTAMDRSELAYIEGDTATPAVVLLEALLRPMIAPAGQCTG